jgi:phosphohistidine phosphatase
MSIQLIIVRHGHAEERKDFKKSGLSDDLRPLTLRGRKEFHMVAKALKKWVPQLTVLGVSPLLRAQQTGVILQHVYKKAKWQDMDCLRPGEPVLKTLTEIKRQLKLTERVSAKNRKRTTKALDERSIAIVGHEPDLGRWIGFMLNGDKRNSLQLKKGGAAIVYFARRIQPGKGRLKCLIQPEQISKLVHR